MPTHCPFEIRFAGRSSSNILRKRLVYQRLDRTFRLQGQYALNVYFNQVCAVLRSAAGRNEKSGRPSPLKDVSALIKLMCSYMAPWHTKDALDIFNLRHDSCTHNKVYGVCVCVCVCVL